MAMRRFSAHGLNKFFILFSHKMGEQYETRAKDPASRRQAECGILIRSRPVLKARVSRHAAIPDNGRLARITA